MRKNQRRFSRKESSLGIHIPTDRYYSFVGLFSLLEQYYYDLSPLEAEYNYLRSILNSLVEVIEVYIEKSLQIDERLSSSNINTFNKKIKILKKENLLSLDSFKKLDQIRKVRNYLIHINPSSKHSKDNCLYQGKSLMSAKSILNLIQDIYIISKEMETIGKYTLNIPILPSWYAEAVAFHIKEKKVIL